MPFPLAHPAAVLPLRRYCPKHLSFPALVIGSLVPDAGYCFGALKVENFSHRFSGLFGFSLPLGLLLVLGLYWLRPIVLRRLPARFQRVLLPESWQPLGSPLGVTLSVLLGGVTHLLLDGLTHKGSWFVQYFPWLEVPVASAGGHTAKVATVLWYGCSFIGVAWLTLAYIQRQRKSSNLVPASLMTGDWASALGVAILVLPIELMHHLVHGQLGSIMVALCSGLLVVVAGWRIAAVASQPAASTFRQEPGRSR